MILTAFPRLLLRMPAGVGPSFAAELAVVESKGIKFRLEPLLQNAHADSSLRAVGQPVWFLAQPAEGQNLDPTHPWDLAHAAVQGLGLAGAPAPEFVEPDLLQGWEYSNDTYLLAKDRDPSIERAMAEGNVCSYSPQAKGLPQGPGFAWHLEEQYSDLKAARDAAGSDDHRVRIAHLDTGFDPTHVTRPRNLRTDLQRNFIDEASPADAADPARRGFLKNPGHGTGTLGILAGNTLSGMAQPDQNTGDFLGGAPFADVIPVRVANSVVQFYTSSIAKGLDYALAPSGDPRNRCHVITMSLGGLPSRAWADAVNHAYDAGIFIVAAAGNNFGGFPTSHVVYPARFGRVVAACAMMANGEPYYGLPITTMQGNFGPLSVMATAMAAFSPNMPWAELGCARLIDMDGAGTSAATPQIAAAAALWLQKHMPDYAEPWMRVEAVRHALFSTASRPGTKDAISEYFGQGALRAKTALDVAPPSAEALKKTAPDSASLGLLRVLTGLGFQSPQNEAMLELEVLQLRSQSKIVEQLAPSGSSMGSARLSATEIQHFCDALLEEPNASQELKTYIQSASRAKTRQVAVPEALTSPQAAPDLTAPRPRTQASSPPPFRRLRTYAFDPSASATLDTAAINQATLKVTWERTKEDPNSLAPGPVGEYLEVVDYDPASGCFYAPVDLNDPFVLAQDGLSPSEGNPQFHQQMVYAVAMTTIGHFEGALGRKVLWSPRHKDGDRYVNEYVQRLRIYPHALREANAFYSPDRKALLFGYFPASASNPGSNLPGGMVFSCLSHDVVAHETTHAILDGIHPRFSEATNRDALAFHEAFADLVALFQHFTLPDALRDQIRKTRGDIAQQSLLGDLARQFGEAIGLYGALRTAIGKIEPGAYDTLTEPHERGALLVGAVFDAFLTIYKSRVADLLRIATGGSGLLPAGDLHPDLVNRLAAEASKAAGHVLAMCIRAVDYSPPFDLTFGEFLRAVITADFDLVPDDDLGYRLAFIDAFRRRGIYPTDVRTLSVETLRWQKPTMELKGLAQILEQLDLSWNLDSDRKEAFELSNQNRVTFHDWLVGHGLQPRDEGQLGLVVSGPLPAGLSPSTTAGPGFGKGRVEVHSLRPLRRVGPDGQVLTDIVVEITQRREVPIDPDDLGQGTFIFRGGCTLLINLRTQAVRCAVSKHIDSARRLERQRQALFFPADPSLRATYYGQSMEPFAALHRGI